jgi:hypothetical protein
MDDVQNCDDVLIYHRHKPTEKICIFGDYFCWQYFAFKNIIREAVHVYRG